MRYFVPTTISGRHVIFNTTSKVYYIVHPNTLKQAIKRCKELNTEEA